MLTRERKYEQLKEGLNEKQWRQYLAMEAVARETKVSPNTIRQGIREIEAGDVYKEGEQSRKERGGRKLLVQTDKTLLADLEGLLHPRGDPMSDLQWTNKPLSHLVKDLSSRGHRIKKSALAVLLHQHRFSLRANNGSLLTPATGTLLASDKSSFSSSAHTWLLPDREKVVRCI